MFKNKAITFILLTAVLVSGKAYGGQAVKDRQVRDIVGKIIKMDEESGVVSIQTGAVAKQAFSDAHLNADLIWGELIKNGYINFNGTIQLSFYKLDKFSNMLLPKMFNARKRLIYDIFQKALVDNGMLVFNIFSDSDLLRGSHHITSIDIGQGDPVTIQYDSSSSGTNNIIRLVDDKSDDS